MGKDEEISRFRVIDGGDKPKRFRKRTGDPEPLICQVCEEDLGYYTQEFIESRNMMFIYKGKADRRSGVRHLICVHCLARGKVTRVV